MCATVGEMVLVATVSVNPAHFLKKRNGVGLSSCPALPCIVKFYFRDVNEECNSIFDNTW